jgi:hypothetical protein
MTNRFTSIIDVHVILRRADRSSCCAEPATSTPAGSSAFRPFIWQVGCRNCFCRTFCWLCDGWWQAPKWCADHWLSGGWCPAAA